jgi:hypothetical protein
MVDVALCAEARAVLAELDFDPDPIDLVRRLRRAPAGAIARALRRDAASSFSMS